MWSLGPRGASSETDRLYKVGFFVCYKRRMAVGNRVVEAIEVVKMHRIENQIAQSGQKTRKAQKVLMAMLAVLMGLVTIVGLLDPMSPCPVYADDTGWKDPTANAADTGGNGDGFELSPENAYSDDTAVASNMNGVGDRHRYYGYDFGLPGGATITGIEVRLDWYVSSAAGAPKLQVELSWDGGISWTSAKQTSNGKTVEQTHILGGPTDTWGRSWTVDELSNANFRVRITCIIQGQQEPNYYLDWVAVKVYNDPPTAVDLASFTARSGLSAAASRGALHLWSWILLAGLAVLAKGQIRRVARRVLYT